MALCDSSWWIKVSIKMVTSKDFVHKLRARTMHSLLRVNVMLKRSHLNSPHSTGFWLQTPELALHTKRIVSCESTVKEVYLFECWHHRISPTDSKVATTLEEIISVEMVRKVIHRSVLFKVKIKTYFVYAKRIYVLVTTTVEFMSLFEHPRWTGFTWQTTLKTKFMEK